MAFADFLTDTMTVKAKANTRAANAGFGRTESTRASSIPCMVMDSATGQAFIGGSRAQINDHPVVTEYDGCENGDTIEIIVAGATVTCRVDGINQRRGRFGAISTFYVLDVQEVDS